MQVLCVVGRSAKGKEQKGAPAELKEEIGYVFDRYTAGAIRQIWSRGDAAGACILMEIENVASAQDLVDNLPLMKAGTLAVEALIELKPYGGFVRPA